MAFVPLNTNNSNLANYNSVNGLMVDYQGFKKAVNTYSAEGWVSGVLPSVSSVAYNGNRSYDITFAGPVTDYLSPGMRLKTVRQVAAPTQCTSLNGTSQYWSRASASINGMTFTNNFTCMGWIKLSSYQAGAIVNRLDASINNGYRLAVTATGQVELLGINTSNANNRIFTTYQSVPLNKWVHVAIAWSTGVGTAYIDGVSVPFATTTAGTAPTTITQGSGDFAVGRNGSSAALFFAGKIAQPAVFSAVLSQATIQSYISQGLSGTETNLVSAYSFNGTGNDLNTTNANNLTAQSSATATNSDSPFSVNGLGTPTGTDDYAIVQKVSSTVATVLVPNGCTIPTSGGIASTYISTAKSPFSMPTNAGSWEVLFILNTNISTSAAVTGTVYNPGGMKFTAPAGQGNLTVKLNCQVTNSTATYDSTIGVSTSSSAFNIYTLMARDYINQLAAASYRLYSFTGNQDINNTNATDYYLLIKSTTGFSQADIRGDLTFSGSTYIRYVPSGL